MPRRQSKTSRASIQAAERRQRAVELRKQGKSHEAIARELGVTPQAISKTLGVALREFAEETREDIEAVRAIEVARLDRMLEALWPGIETGDTKAIDTGLRLATRRADLLGLDAPKRQDIEQKNLTAQVVLYVPDNGRGPK